MYIVLHNRKGVSLFSYLTNCCWEDNNYKKLYSKLLPYVNKRILIIQWSLSIADSIGTNISVLNTGVSSFQA